jgi:hypothetical protein
MPERGLAARTGRTPHQAKLQSNGIVMLAIGIPDGIRPSPQNGNAKRPLIHSSESIAQLSVT